jgi:branched-chain amino acid transport system permease protein
MNIVQLVIDAISVGGLYALTAIGIGLIFGVVGLVNFAYGEYVMVGAYVILLCSGFDWYVAILVVAACVTAFALLTYFAVFRPAQGASPATLMIVSFGLSYMIQHLYVMVFGSLAQTVNFLPGINRSVELAGLRISAVNILQILSTLVLTLGLAAIIRFTKVGYQMRAVSENPRMARLVGVKTNHVVAAAFVCSALLAVTVSVLFVAQTGSMTPFFGVQLTMIGFVATVIGGLGSLIGCALGGFLVGLVTTILQHTLPADLQPFREAFVFGAVILMLLLRPEGLIATSWSRERV